MKKGAIGVVEELAEQGYSIKESLEVLGEAKQIIKNNRKFVDKQIEGTLLKDALRQQEEFMGELRANDAISSQQLEGMLKESNATFEELMKKYLEHNHRLRFPESKSPSQEAESGGALSERQDLQEA